MIAAVKNGDFLVRRPTVCLLVAHVKAAAGLRVGHDFPQNSSKHTLDSLSMFRRNSGIVRLHPLGLPGFRWIVVSWDRSTDRRPVHRIFLFSDPIAPCRTNRAPWFLPRNFGKG